MSSNKNSFLVIALIIIFTIVGIGFGYYLTPEYKLSMYEKNTMDLGVSDRWFDLRYINAMISHHRGAMLMAEKAASETKRQEIKDLTAEILKNEPTAINELYKWKKDWYNDSRKVTDPIVANFGTYDEKYDLRFINALIAHHQSGILMTKETRLKSNRAEILNNADAVEEFLTNSIKMLNEWRKNLYQI
ncbi:MAG: DUF305 domain-containing protein [Candidatus Shapirobacteria bacterium]|nr:DUF305 domain-containing protein [Candidatus Shapirobacteria bacterium]